MCIMWSRRVPRHCTLWKFCVHMGWATQPSSLSTGQSSSPSWCTARLHGGALQVPAIDSEYRRSSVAASVVGSLHQTYRHSPTCVVKPMITCLTASSTTVTTSYVIFLRHHRRHSTTVCDPWRHNPQLSIGSTSLTDRHFLQRMLHSDSYWV